MVQWLWNAGEHCCKYKQACKMSGFVTSFFVATSNFCVSGIDARIVFKSGVLPLCGRMCKPAVAACVFLSETL